MMVVWTVLSAFAIVGGMSILTGYIVKALLWIAAEQGLCPEYKKVLDERRLLKRQNKELAATTTTMRELPKPQERLGPPSEWL